MAFVNLPPNFQDIFSVINDRISKLETGPNQAMYTAEAAQGSSAQALSVATNAQIQAINAEVEANNAAAQATIAQAQATIASAQATAAQTSANGKNTNHYSTSGPGSTSNIAGDLWFQYGTSSPYTNKVIAQYVGLGGTSWQSMPITGLVVTNIDAGSITTGTLSAIQISAGSGANSFNVSSSGVMSAQGVYVKGAIVADSGTFTGSIRADAGYFGTGTGATLTNGWSIGATGLTGVGSGTITGGTITGSYVQTSSGNNAVVLDGSQNALGVKSGGSFAGWIASIGSGAVLMHYGSSPSSTAYPRTSVSSGAATVSGTASSGFSANSDGTNGITGNSTYYGTSTFSNTVTMNSVVNIGTTNTSGSVYSEGIRSFTTGSAANTYVNPSTGIMARSTASSQRYKHDIVNLVDVPELDPKALYNLPVRAFRFNENYLPDTDERANVLVPGFIAEEVAAVYPIAADFDNGQVENWNDRMLIPALLSLIQDLHTRVVELESKIQ